MLLLKAAWLCGLLWCSCTVEGVLTYEQMNELFASKRLHTANMETPTRRSVHMPSWAELENMFNNSYFPTVDRAFIARALSPHGYMGDMKTLHRAISSAVRRGELIVLVLGGSVPSGYRSKPGTAWPWQLERYLNSILGFNITLVNMAFRAAPSQSQATFQFRNMRRFIEIADLILVDISANDRPTDRQNVINTQLTNDISWESVRDYDRFLELAEGRLFMQLILLHKKANAGLLYIDVHTSTEVLSPVIRSRSDLLTELSKPPCGDEKRRDKCSYTEHKDVYICPADVSTFPHWMPIIQLKIPMLAFPTAVCPIIGTGKNRFWTGLHPPAQCHDFLAQMLTAAVYELSAEDFPDYTSPTGPIQDADLRAQIADWNMYVYSKFSGQRNSSAADLKAAECATDPKTDMTTMRAKHFKPLFRGEDWSYLEDVPGKPGWICQPRSNAVKVTLPENIHFRSFVAGTRDVVFLVKTGILKPRVILQMLVSYTDVMGTITCGLYDTKGDLVGRKRFVHSTRGSDRTSQTHGFEMDLPVADGVPSAKPEDDYFLFHMLCRADSGKIKITSLVGC